VTFFWGHSVDTRLLTVIDTDSYSKTLCTYLLVCEPTFEIDFDNMWVSHWYIQKLLKTLAKCLSTTNVE